MSQDMETFQHRLLRFRSNIRVMPKVVVIAGPNGAGKSTAAPLLLREALAVEEFVNADTLAAGLSAFAPEEAAFAAGRLMLRRLYELAEERRDFAFETTLSSRSFAPWVKQLKTVGYSFELVYLWLPDPDLALTRVAERVRRGGHDVPAEVVRRRYDKSLRNFFHLYQRLADFWLMVDNSDARQPQMIAWREARSPVIVRIDRTWNALKARYEQK